MKIVFACLILFALIFPVCAQEKRLDSSPQTFRAFFSKFKAAVRRSDKIALASMMRFPFKYGFDAGDEGVMTKTQFLKTFSYRFADPLKQTLIEKNPLFSIGEKASYIISTEDASHFTFVKTGNGFKFVSYMAEP